MEKSLIEMAVELVQAQCVSKNMTTEEITQSLQGIFKTLHNLQQDKGRELVIEDDMPATTTLSPEGSIQQHKVTCLECGEEFKMLSSKHLRSHDLNGRQYRRKWGLPLRQPLCARELSERRKKAGKARGLPENLRKVIAARGKSAKTPSQPSATILRKAAGSINEE
ncbi:MAG: transcriptional regulator [Desulfobulbaceae bacterium]|nr:MAG: transcriptional regulator [Desulfobulbaceae bacterium]